MVQVKRPSDYIPPEPKSASVAVGTMTNSFGVSDRYEFPNVVLSSKNFSPYKIFIGGIPAHLTEEQVKELVSAFGPVKNFNLVKDAITAQSKVNDLPLFFSLKCSRGLPFLNMRIPVSRIKLAKVSMACNFKTRPFLFSVQHWGRKT